MVTVYDACKVMHTQKLAHWWTLPWIHSEILTSPHRVCICSCVCFKITPWISNQASPLKLKYKRHLSYHLGDLGFIKTNKQKMWRRLVWIMLRLALFCDFWLIYRGTSLTVSCLNGPLWTVACFAHVHVLNQASTQCSSEYLSFFFLLITPATIFFNSTSACLQIVVIPYKFLGKKFE